MLSPIISNQTQIKPPKMISLSVDFTNPEVTLDKIEKSTEAKKMLKQMEKDHDSIINQGEIYI